MARKFFAKPFVAKPKKKKEKAYIAKTETQIRKVANTTKDQSTEDKEGKICATCKKLKPLHRYYQRENKKPEIHCRDCRNIQREKKIIDIGNKNLFIS